MERRLIEGIVNLTSICALTLLVVWIILVFVAHIGSGAAQLPYAAAMVLLARRVAVGAPKFLS